MELQMPRVSTMNDQGRTNNVCCSWLAGSRGLQHSLSKNCQLGGVACSLLTMFLTYTAWHGVREERLLQFWEFSRLPKIWGSCSIFVQSFHF